MRKITLKINIANEKIKKFKLRELKTKIIIANIHDRTSRYTSIGNIIINLT